MKRETPLLTLIDDPASTAETPLPRLLACAVRDGNGVLAAPFRLDEVVAIKVTLYAEGSRTVAEGKINIIKKSNSLNKVRVLESVHAFFFLPAPFSLSIF